MRYLVGCLVSAVLGAGLAVWLAEGSAFRVADAQEPRGGRSVRGPRLTGPEPAADDYDAPFHGPVAADVLFGPDGLTPEEAVNVAVYERCNKGVVNITTKTTKADALFLLEVVAEGSGSGAVIDRKGHVLTNYHVVEDANHINCTLFDGKSYDGTVIGADPINDIAVVKIDAPEDVLFPIPLGDSSQLKVGMRVYAIGNPFGLERTMTTGIISSLNRSLQVYRDRSIKSIIQIDAAVNPGNSGGPLLDSHGRLIGVNTAIASKTGQSAGVGFAIPVSLIARVAPQLIAHGRYQRPESGILRVYETGEGLLVAQLTPNGPAEAAGLRGPRTVKQRRGPFVVERIDRSAADLIVEADGEKVKTADDFLSYLEGKQPGDTIELTVVRDKRRIRIPLTLGKSETPPAKGR